MSWKKALLVGLVLLLVLVGLPMLMPGMGGSAWAECVAVAATCGLAAVVVGSAAILATAAWCVTRERDRNRPSLFVTLLERPPRYV